MSEELDYEREPSKDLTAEELEEMYQREREKAQRLELESAVLPADIQKRIDKLLASAAHQDGVLQYERVQAQRFFESVQSWVQSDLETIRLLADGDHFAALKAVLPRAAERISKLVGIPSPSEISETFSLGGTPPPVDPSDGPVGNDLI